MAISKELLTFGNSKTGDSVGNFSLPRNKEICIGMTPACKAYCYAKRRHFAQKNCINKYADNYRRVLEGTFEKDMANELQYQSNYGMNRLRLHSSGDFFSQDYLDTWKSLARYYKTITIVAYTKSWQLDYSKKPRNLKLFYSIDDTTEFYPTLLTRRAEVVPKEVYLQIGKKKKQFVCKSSCYKCKACFVDSKKDVLFLKH